MLNVVLGEGRGRRRREGTRGWMEEMQSGWPLNPSSGTTVDSAEHSLLRISLLHGLHGDHYGWMVFALFAPPSPQHRCSPVTAWSPLHILSHAPLNEAHILGTLKQLTPPSNLPAILIHFLHFYASASTSPMSVSGSATLLVFSAFFSYFLLFSLCILSKE